MLELSRKKPDCRVKERLGVRLSPRAIQPAYRWKRLLGRLSGLPSFLSKLVLKAMKEKFGEKVYGKYGFVDAFNPNNGWINPDVIGIDVGITLLSAENLRSGKVWRWFMRNREITRALRLAGIV
jgi:hypothetical protein